MIVTEPSVDALEFEARTGWAIKPAGACRADVCVPLPPGAHAGPGRLDVLAVAAQLGMPVVTDAEHGLTAIGPATAGSGRALTTAVAPDVELPDVDGNPFRLSSLLGRKVLLVAWASW